MIDFTKNLPRHGSRSPLTAHRPANSPSHARALISGLPLGALAYLLLCAGVGTALFHVFGNEPGLGDLPLWASAVALLSFLVIGAAAAATANASFLMSIVAMATLPMMLRILTELADTFGDAPSGLSMPAAQLLHGAVSTAVQWGIAAMLTLMALSVFAGSGPSAADEDISDED